MEIKVNLKPSGDWMHRLAEQFGVKSKSQTEFYHTEGESFFRLHATFFEKKVSVFLGDLSWVKPLSTFKISLGTNDYWTLTFILSDAMHTHDLWDEKNKQQIQGDKTALLFSSKMAVNTHWPVGKRSRFVAMSFQRDWLYEQLGINTSDSDKDRSPLFKLFSSESGVYVQGVSLFDHTISIDKLFEDTNAFTWRLSAQAQCYKLIADFIGQMERKETLKEINKINHHDLKQIMSIENQYFVLTQPLPNVEFLAREAGMSLSKFKKCFKEIYGLPPYEYHLNQKLEIAKTQLLQNKWSVSEIAAQLGYTSSANFDKAFKKRFMMSPTAMLKQV
ncbi:MAG: AraC family transcriptional regulator [Spirosomataceae bacterium]